MWIWIVAGVALIVILIAAVFWFGGPGDLSMPEVGAITQGVHRALPIIFASPLAKWGEPDTLPIPEGLLFATGSGMTFQCSARQKEDGSVGLSVVCNLAGNSRKRAVQAVLTVQAQLFQRLSETGLDKDVKMEFAEGPGILGAMLVFSRDQWEVYAKASAGRPGES